MQDSGAYGPLGARDESNKRLRGQSMPGAGTGAGGHWTAGVEDSVQAAIKATVKQAARTASDGSDGAKAATLGIFGQPGAGKSSLWNILVKAANPG